MVNTTYKTPMLQQYQAMKEQYPDCLLFFRLGDFYELFGDDAKIGSEVLHLTLTARDKGSDGKIPMCGVPYHASENYVARLVKAGYRVAICEQTTPAGKGLVEREVIRVVSAGTLLREESLTEAASQYIVSFSLNKGEAGGAAADLSTGSFYTFSFKASPRDVIPMIMSHFSPRECIVPRSIYENGELISLLRQESQVNITCVHDWLIYIKDAEEMLKKQFQVESLDTFGLRHKPEAIKAVAALLGYLKYTQKGEVAHITTLAEFHTSGYLVLDPTTLRHLEVIRTSDGTIQDSLFGTINHTMTASGQRKLQDWLLHPITNRTTINERLDAVEELLTSPQTTTLRDDLTQVSDIERLVSRLSVRLGTPRDLRRLVDTLWLIDESILLLLKEFNAGRLKTLATPLATQVRSFVVALRDQLFSEAKPTLDDGYIFEEGFYPELDELRQLTSGNKAWLAGFEAKERERTGIPKLKVVYSRAFGYAIEVSKINKDKVPSDYVPRQTLVNAERFTCQPLADYEHKALSAQDKMNQLEKELFASVVNEVINHSSDIIATAQRIAETDVLVSFAEVARTRNYTRPKLTEEVGISIRNGRHPVIETLSNEAFVANDTKLSPKRSFQLITGPNMAGKSTYIRQVALITLLAHTGSFVPADKATIGITDRIFTRIGAHDNLRQAQSTFMVEMLETAHILHNATPQSLVILDEVGRGTSPEDGFALAWAIAEALAHDDKGLVLFATHFHDLKDIATTHPRVFNSHLTVSAEGNDLIFLRKVADGATNESFGIMVAEKAGVPKPIIERAKTLALDPPNKEKVGIRKTNTNQLALLPEVNAPSKIEAKLKDLDINTLTPLEALTVLSELQEIL